MIAANGGVANIENHLAESHPRCRRPVYGVYVWDILEIKIFIFIYEHKLGPLSPFDSDFTNLLYNVYI